DARPRRGSVARAGVAGAPAYCQAVAVGERLRLVQVRVPDAEARSGAAGVGAVGGAAAEARVHADDHGALRKGAAVAVELVERAGVVEDAQRDELLEPAGRHLRGELDAPGGEAGAQRALDLGV